MSVSRGRDNGDDVSQDSDKSEHQGFIGLDVEQEDNCSITSEQSSDLGEIERERVRQIFREWMSNGSKSHSYEFDLNSRSEQWLGENECERVRVIREWVQMNSQQRNNCGSLRDGVVKVCSQIEQVRDGLAISHPDIGARRPIRRFCGRQTLLDLLLRAQSERKRELLGLSEQRPVSDFAHRNRIQGLLKGRFLRNESLVLDKRPSSVAATDLVLLRQRQTVSDLRVGFLSKLDNSASTSVNGAHSVSTSGGENNWEMEFPCREKEVAGVQAASDLDGAADEDRSLQESDVQITEAANPVLDNEKTEQEVLHGVGSANSRDEPTWDTEARQQEVFADVEHGEQIHDIINNEPLLDSEEIHSSGTFEVFGDTDEQRSTGRTVDMETNTNEEFDSQDALAQVEVVQESVIEIQGETFRSLQEGSANQWLPGTSCNNVEQDQMQELHGDWPSHDFQEAIDSWLDIPSGEIDESVERIDSFYFSDDDNAHSMELRELFSRRRVSSLLRSDFRESLDQVLQSHVERQGHESGVWEQDNTSSPVLVEQDQGQLSGDQTSALSNDSESNPLAPSSPFLAPFQLHWDRELQSANWPHHISNQQIGTVWEVINELRIDMARLHQRMNNMQSMLEACVDMQIELQRSVRQEVSAALNRAIFSRGDANKTPDNQLRGESDRWDHVRKGICCLCQDSKIDSLLYRCGHMCSCSKCAENLIQLEEKCPMCQAPVVEVVRTYFVQ